VYALVRQPEREELADAVIGQIPADRASALGHEIHDAQGGERVDLQAAQRARHHQTIEAGSVQLLDEGFRQALLAFDRLLRVA
jgi:hypothetical protein